MHIAKCMLDEVGYHIFSFLVDVVLTPFSGET